MIIDFHTHTFPDAIADKTISYLADKAQIKPYASGKLDGLISSMKKNSIDISVILPIVTKPSQFDTINRVAYEINDSYQNAPYRPLSFGGIHPQSSNYMDELNIIKNYGFKGIKIHPDYQQTFIDDPLCERILYRASELGLIISIHAGFDGGWPDLTHATPERILNVIKDVAPEKFVLAHMGACMMWDKSEEILIGQDVYLDTAFCCQNMDSSQLTRMIKNHGTDKVLFATDSPWSDQGADSDVINSLDLSDCEKNNILSRNALKLLDL